MAQDKAQKAMVMKRQMDLLNERYDLSRHVITEVTRLMYLAWCMEKTNTFDGTKEVQNPSSLH